MIVDCSSVDSELTDFAFDQLERSDISEFDYENQQIAINDEGDINDIKEDVFESCLEKANDMLREAKSGYSVGYTVSELENMRSQLTTARFTVIG